MILFSLRRVSDDSV